MSTPTHTENHRIDRIDWLRAAVLGANDGILSTSSLIVGVAASAASQDSVVLVGLAGLVAGAMSMAAGEFVSVSSQADAENADIEREQEELRDDPQAELRELTQIYVARGLSDGLARQVAAELTENDALGAHVRDELGISQSTRARPLQAAMASGASFALGAAAPLGMAAIAPAPHLLHWTIAATLMLLLALGGLGAAAGGASAIRGAVRVALWGVVAMAATAAVGHLFGTQLV